MREFDYVIVGAGSAGCVLAGRLSEDAGACVLLLEAGGSDDSMLVRMPAGIAALVPTRLRNWSFQTEPQPGLGGRRGFQPRGKVLGGSSSINAMVYIRGQPADYDAWAAAGNRGWSYRDVLPYFKRAEHHEAGADEFHGEGGPLNVAALRTVNPLSQAFLAAAAQVQLPLNTDFNGATQEGIGLYEVTQRNGERWSAARAYLDPARTRSNLTIETGAHATRLIMEGRRAAGVEFRQGRRTLAVRARREVLLSAGVFGSPQLLLLSGIGPGEALRTAGIEAVHDLPGVGENLHDHVDHVTIHRCLTRDPLGFSPAGVLQILRAVRQWRSERRGTLTTNFAEAGGFLRSQPELARPDIQLHFVIGIVDDHNRKLHLGHGYSCHVCVLRPVSRGRVRLASPDPAAPPSIDPGFLIEQADVDTLVKGFKAVRRILEAPAFAPYRGTELYTEGVTDDTAIEAWIRRRADSLYHPVGTCRMGPDAMAVVDRALQVRGVEGLRVVDASVMPTIVSGNTNAPTMMIAERASDLIRGLVPE